MAALRWPMRQVLRALEAGGVVAYPTEAVYGLGCDPCSESALAELLALKQRPAHKGLILIAHELDVLRPWLQPIPATLEPQLMAGWPGPITWLLPVADHVSPLLCGHHETLAVRVTAHPLAAALCRAFGGPIVSTSANPATRPPARSALAVRRYFGDRLDAILPGPLGTRRRPTEIRHGVTGAIVRRG